MLWSWEKGGGGVVGLGVARRDAGHRTPVVVLGGLPVYGVVCTARVLQEYYILVRCGKHQVAAVASFPDT